MVSTSTVNKESFKNRLGKYNGSTNKNLNLVFNIEASLPLCITIDDRIDELTFSTDKVTVAAGPTNKITDPEYENINGKERYIFMGALKSPMTKNVVFLYYDNLYNDIIVTPDLSFLDLSSANSLFSDIRCYRIGSGHQLPNENLNKNLIADEIDAFKLPEPKTGLTLTTHLVSLPGYGLYTDHYGGGFEEQINNGINLIHDNRKLGLLVKLGPMTNVFNKTSSLPLYLLYQYGVLDYGIKYINNVNPETKNLWLTIKF